jgi:hypothetical protein
MIPADDQRRIAPDRTTRMFRQPEISLSIVVGNEHLDVFVRKQWS